MRRVSNPQSAAIYPLNRILSTEGNVRLLRVLAGTSAALSIAELARKSGLTDRGTRTAVSGLEATGAIEVLGSGRTRQVRMRRKHPLAASLKALFRTEARHFEALLDAIQKTISSLPRPPSAVWLQSPGGGGSDQADDPIVVGLLADAIVVDNVVLELAKAIEKVERSFDVTIEVRGLTRADLNVMNKAERAQIAESISLVGPSPFAYMEDVGSKGTKGRRRRGHHIDLDVRGIALGSAIAEAISRDPALIERARAWIAKRMKKASVGERQELEEWRRLLSTASPARIRKLLTDPGQRATRLRQTLPFLEALSKAERDAIVGDASADHESGKKRR